MNAEDDGVNEAERRWWLNEESNNSWSVSWKDEVVRKYMTMLRLKRKVAFYMQQNFSNGKVSILLACYFTKKSEDCVCLFIVIGL
ncbi:hypothetical protein EYC80_008802 [Monilinia laxa]|uniref:Uncharacterized protein n=1 Tax=Monilinia laxa TaxID=61186 RepID=A0A5N6K1I6_MONLA|nr:hypothetical protein EYC80_008802 [Monilinia laxa]